MPKQNSQHFADNIFQCIPLCMLWEKFDWNFSEVCSQGPISGNDLAPDRREAISWTSVYSNMLSVSAHKFQERSLNKMDAVGKRDFSRLQFVFFCLSPCNLRFNCISSFFAHSEISFSGPLHFSLAWLGHYDDVIMMAIASQITSLTIVYSAVYSGAHQRKHQSSASLAFVWGIHRGPVNSPHKWPVTRKMFPFDDVIMASYWCRRHPTLTNYSSTCCAAYHVTIIRTWWQMFSWRRILFFITENNICALTKANTVVACIFPTGHVALVPITGVTTPAMPIFNGSTTRGNVSLNQCNFAHIYC